MISIAVLDDDENVLREIRSYIERFANVSGNTVDAKYYSSAVQFLDNTSKSYDIIFLDIEMPYRNGMQVAEKIRERDDQALIIFITNMAQYAIKGYEVQAYSFLVKPVNYLSISTLLGRAFKRVESIKQQDIIIIDTPTGKHKIAVSDIRFVEISGHKIYYHVRQKTVIAWGSLKKVENELAPYDFVKCNACYLVNLRYVSSVEGFLLRLGDVELAISQSKKKTFMDKLTEYLSR